MGHQSTFNLKDVSQDPPAVGLIRARWNGHITAQLTDGVKQTLTAYGVGEQNIREAEVPGSFELPWMAQEMVLDRGAEVVIAVGCLIQGETPHFEYLAGAVSHGLTRVSIDHETPVVFGVLTALNEEQARARSEGENNLGISWAKTALETGEYVRQKGREVGM